MPTSEPDAFPAGTVVVVPFPYSDRHAEKRRPALVVSGPRLAEVGLLWVVMITTAKAGIRTGDVPIDDLAGAGLTAPCLVRPSKIACIEPSRVLRRSGGLPPQATQRVLNVTRSFLAAASARARPSARPGR